MVDLGATPLKVKGEDQLLQMTVIDSKKVACELHAVEIDEWPEVTRAPVRYLRQSLGLNSEDILHTWGETGFPKQQASSEPAGCRHNLPDD